MKVRDTSRGRMYAVASNPGCTVINGDMAVDVPAGGQSVILALDKKLIIDGDDAAKFVEVRWGTNAAIGSRPINWMGDVVDGLVSIVGADKFDLNYISTENKLYLVFSLDTTNEQLEEVERLLESVLPGNVVTEMEWAGGMPIEYTPVEYLESTGTQGISVPYNFDKNTGIEVSGLFPIGYTTNMAVLVPLASPKYVSALYLAYRDNKEYRLVTSEYGTSYNGVEVQVNNLGKKSTARYNWLGDKILYVDNGEKSTSRFNDKYVGNGKNSYVGILYDGRFGTYYKGLVFSVKLSQFDKVTLNMVPALDPTGAPCMFDTVSGQNFYNQGDGSFIVGFETAEQARKLATLPDVTAETDATKKSLTVSLPLALAFDDGVQSALDIASARGWTIIVQYRASELTTKNIDADFLEATGTQYIDTGIVPTKETGLRLTAIPPSHPDTIPFGSRNSDTTRTRFYAVRPRRIHNYIPGHVIPNGYGWGDWFPFNNSSMEGGAELIKKEETSLNWFNDRKAISEYGERSLAALPFTPELSMYLFAANISSSASLAYIGRIWSAAVSVGTRLKANFVPALDSTGIPCMYDTVSDQNFYNANTTEGAAPFIVGFDTTEKAAVSLSKLPITTDGTLTVSLPAEAQDTDTLVPAAIDIAKSLGWTIITQYRTN